MAAMALRASHSRLVKSTISCAASVGVCAWSPAIGTHMQAERHIQILGRGPKRLVHGMIVAMLHGSQRSHGSGQPDVGDATQLAGGDWGLVHIEHGDAFEAFRVGFAKVS